MSDIATKKSKPKKPSLKQRRAAQFIVDNATGKRTFSSSKELVKAVGYKDSVAEAPHKVLETPGVTEALNDLGFTEERAKSVVNKILESDEAENRDRLRAADLVFKVQGSYASDKIAAQNNANPIVFAKIEQHVYNFESQLKKALGYESSKVIEPKDGE